MIKTPWGCYFSREHIEIFTTLRGLTVQCTCIDSSEITQDDS